MNKIESSTIKSLFGLYRAGEYRTLLERTRALLETNPDELTLHSLAGAACLELEDYDAAITSYQAALALKPDFAKLHNSLGIAYLRTGQVKNAADSFHNAARHDPEFAQAWFNLGIVYENRQRLPEAAGYYKQATLINPVYHQALCSLAKTLWELRIPDQVEEYFEKAIAIEETYLAAHMGLLHFLEQSNRHEKLRDAVSRARKVPGLHETVRLYEGILADIGGDYERARSLLEAFSITPADVWTRHGERTRLARLTLICDRLDDTPAALRYAGRANDLSQEISDSKGIDKSGFLQIVENRRRYFTAGNINRWPDVTSESRGQSKISDEILTPTPELFPSNPSFRRKPESSETTGRPAGDTISHWMPGQARHDEPVGQVRHDEESRGQSKISDEILTPTPELGRNFTLTPGIGNPVFIIGFPRSGTTLLDTLLRGHPGLEVTEETDAVPRMVNQLSGNGDERMDSLADLADQDVENLRKTYFNALARHARPDSNAILIDRFALNIVYAGEIVRIFPQARFILLLRHPADCVLSCFMQTFYETPANASFFTLEDSAHLYDRVFGLWRQYTDLLQLNVLQVKYEDLVADAESTCRPILDFLDAPWHPGILEHERTARDRPLIGTASYNQVTRPLYTDAQGRWRRYRQEMEPALPVLEPWITYFGYKESPAATRLV